MSEGSVESRFLLVYKIAHAWESNRISYCPFLHQYLVAAGDNSTSKRPRRVLGMIGECLVLASNMHHWALKLIRPGYLGFAL
jgi:hypothetical protein